MKVAFLGTNGWYDSSTGSTVCTLVRTRRFDIILDAGYGLHKLDEYPPAGRDVFILLSHFHLDHIAGLHVLVKFKGLRSLTICGQKGTRALLKRFVNSPFTVPLAKLPYPVKLLELPSEAAKLPFKVKSLPLEHADPVLGFRIGVEGKMLAYCTDTGYCPNALELARGADLLITECAHAPGETNPGWPHFNPETAAKLALDSGARRLAVTHYSADRYRTAAARAAGIRISRRIFPGAVAAKDGLELDL